MLPRRLPPTGPESLQRRIHLSPVLSARRARRPPPTPSSKSPPHELFDLENMPQFKDDDASSISHRQLSWERLALQYLRLIDRDMLSLRAMQQPFSPPPNSPIYARSISYGNEVHPAARKRTIVVPVDDLPLPSPQAVHKFLILAGVHWSPLPPKDAGLAPDAKRGLKGYIKISCERFPQPEMNLAWAINSLSNLVREANKLEDETFADIPLDFRHIDAQRLKRRRGDHRSGLHGRRPSVADFPREWLPDPPMDIVTET